MAEDDQEEGILKRVKNIGDKNEELLKAFNAVNKVSKSAKNEGRFNYDSK